MADYRSSEIVDILLVLGECQLNYHEASRVYWNRYPVFGIPNLLKEKKGGNSKRRGTFGAERVRANLTARVNLAERPARQLEQRCARQVAPRPPPILAAPAGRDAK